MITPNDAGRETITCKFWSFLYGDTVGNDETDFKLFHIYGIPVIEYIPVQDIGES